MSETQAATFTADGVVTGMCLWEAMLTLVSGKGPGARTASERRLREKASEMLDDHGSFTCRGALVSLVTRCEAEWKAHLEKEGEGDQFDWDWCPRFLKASIEDGTLDEAIEGQYRPD